MRPPGREPENGWVLYDGSCGFCSRWVPFWGSTLRKRGFEIARLQEEWVRRDLALSGDELLVDLLLFRPGKELVRGADVYRFAMKRIWWARPFYLISILPVCRGIFDWSYRTFARNRYRVSSACRMPGDE